MRNRTTLAAAIGLVFFLCGFARAADVTLYSKKNYEGHSLKIRGDERNLATRGFNDRVSSLKIKEGAWQLCSGTNFDGKCVVLDPGRYRSLEDIGLEDRISSVRRVGRGHWGHDSNGEGHRDAVVLYKKEDFEGDSQTIYDRESDLHDVGFDDKASSVVIRYGRWDFCSKENFRGDCVTLGPGRYSSLKRMGLNDRVSSVRRSGDEWGSHHDRDRRDSEARGNPQN